MCVYASELQDLEPSSGPAAVPRPTTSLTTSSSLPVTKSQVQQRAADIQRQLEVCTELTLYVLVTGRNTGEMFVLLMLIEHGNFDRSCHVIPYHCTIPHSLRNTTIAPAWQFML